VYVQMLTTLLSLGATTEDTTASRLVARLPSTAHEALLDLGHTLALLSRMAPRLTWTARTISG
jgi:hypothetical protein